MGRWLVPAARAARAERMRHLYYHYQLSVAVIAQRFGCSGDVVKKALKEGEKADPAPPQGPRVKTA